MTFGTERLKAQEISPEAERAVIPSMQEGATTREAALVFGGEK